MTEYRLCARNDVAATSMSLFQEVGVSASLLSGFVRAERAAFAPQEREEIDALSCRLKRLASVVAPAPETTCATGGEPSRKRVSRS